MAISLKSCTSYILNNFVIHQCDSYDNRNCQCKSIEEVSYYKYLGVQFDTRKIWSNQINVLTRKTRRFSFALIRLKEMLAEKGAKRAYSGCIQYLHAFGTIAWEDGNSTSLFNQCLSLRKNSKQPLTNNFVILTPVQDLPLLTVLPIVC